MNKFIEPESILTFRKKSFDVSNISVDRIEKAEIIWNKEVLRDGFTTESINKMSENVGLYLIRQDFSVLLFRMTFMKALKSYISRYLLTLRNIKKSNKAEYEEFQAWVLFVMTGKKKDLLEVETSMMESSTKIMKSLMDQGYDLELCQDALLTFLKGQEKPLKPLENTPLES